MLLETVGEQFDAVWHDHVEQGHGEQPPEVALQQPGEPGVPPGPLGWPQLHAGGVLPGPHIAP